MTITGQTKDIRILNNEIRETRKPMQRTGIRIGEQVGKVELADNRIEGFAMPVSDARRSVQSDS